MPNHAPHDNATSNVLAWSSHGANVEPAVEEDAGADADEPPDRTPTIPVSPVANRFQKTVVRQLHNHQESLLTKALQSQSEDETGDGTLAITNSKRRRSMTSNVSLASTADLTSDTGITTPARTSSPSPRLSSVGFVPLVSGRADLKAVGSGLDAIPKGDLGPNDSPTTPTQHGKISTVAEKKRCISFACVAKPVQKDSVMPPPPLPNKIASKPAPPDATVRPCIKFACTSRPTAQDKAPAKDETQPQKLKSIIKAPAVAERSLSPTSVRKLRSSSVISQSRGGRSSTPRRSAQSPVAVKSKKYLTAESQDLQCESSRFHEFASDEFQEDDWIRQDKSTMQRRLTIDDTLQMELAFRRLGKEAEEEAEQEEDDEEGNDKSPTGNANDELDVEVEEEEEDEEEDEEEEEEEEDEEDEDEDEIDDDIDHDVSDGYNTDNEVGFASSDDEDDDLVLWTTRRPSNARPSGATPVNRRPSFGEHSDSSAYSPTQSRLARSKQRRAIMRYRPGTPELPDSTDFVCGTLDEDRPLEEAYKSCMAARKLEKLHLIPQDIDPSFPTSGPEDEGEELFKPGQHASDDHVWLHGELEDLHHGQERVDRRKKKGDSPKRYHSPPPKRHHHSPPPPKRHHSPPPKARGRSPRRLFDRHSPARKARSPMPPQLVDSPPASPVQAGEGIAFKSLAFRPGLTHTKSLPKAPVMFPNMKPHRRGRANTINKDKHIRGAIDIVKGLEQKRQRRKEKFQQKYCNRARKGQVHEKKPQPGLGAERMKELGLLMAGKIGQGNYVLSF